MVWHRPVELPRLTGWVKFPPKNQLVGIPLDQHGKSKVFWISARKGASRQDEASAKGGTDRELLLPLLRISLF
jgi:hypothetical protein